MMWTLLVRKLNSSWRYFSDTEWLSWWKLFFLFDGLRCFRARMLFAWMTKSGLGSVDQHLHSHQPSGVMSDLYSVSQWAPISFYLQHQSTGLIQSLSAAVKVLKKPRPTKSKSLWALKTFLRLSRKLLFALEENHRKEYQFWLDRNKGNLANKNKGEEVEISRQDHVWLVNPLFGTAVTADAKLFPLAGCLVLNSQSLPLSSGNVLLICCAIIINSWVRCISQGIDLLVFISHCSHFSQLKNSDRGTETLTYVTLFWFLFVFPWELTHPLWHFKGVKKDWSGNKLLVKFLRWRHQHFVIFVGLETKLSVRLTLFIWLRVFGQLVKPSTNVCENSFIALPSKRGIWGALHLWSRWQPIFSTVLLQLYSAVGQESNFTQSSRRLL